MKKLFTLLVILIPFLVVNAQFSGDYNIGTGQTYTTLKAACDAMNAGTITGDCTFYITSDLTEASNFGLGVNTNGHSITFRPDSDVDRIISYTSTTDNTGFSGHFVLGSSNPLVTTSDANTIGTSNVTFNGYAVGGTTRRLKFKNAAASAANARIFTIAGDCQNTVIKNCIIENNSTSTTSPVGIVAVVRKGTAIDFGPTNLTIENNVITSLGSVAGMGMRATNSGTPTSRLTGLVFKNNSVTAKRRLLELNYTVGGDIYNNEFTTNQTGTPATVSYGVWTATSVTGTINIYNNKFLSSLTEETGAFGHRVVSLSSGATYNIYNNMFSGMNKTKVSSVALNLTYLFYSGVSGKIYHNTFYMPALTDASSTGYYSCIQLSGNTAEIKNNIFIGDEPTHANTYFISAVPTPASDYNLFYHRQSNAGTKYVATYTTLAAYKSANPTKDVNSNSANVLFTGATDLTLTGASIGDATNLTGTYIEGYTTDFEGHTRVNPPYKGADEIPASPLPVELSAFTVSVKDGKALLQWKTATEINTNSFIIERAAVSDMTLQWNSIGEVRAAGNSNSERNYQFVDNNMQSGKFVYRLKMVDNDGTFEYSKSIEFEGALPKEFKLAQNYPNPFNPSTTIEFMLPADAQVALELYAISGEKVATVIEKNLAAGSHAVSVNMQSYGLGTGVYFYRMTAVASNGEKFVNTKKMIVLK